MPEHQKIIQSAIVTARSSKAPNLDVERCLKLTSPANFLRMLWSELAHPASVGEMEICRRIATYVLTTPRCPNIPPLLPIFLHTVLPSLIMATDRQPTTEQNVSIELMVAIVSSSLSAALHLEWAYHMISHERRNLLGQTSAGMARRFVQELRLRRDSEAAKGLAQRIASTQAFITNFSMFLGDLII